MDTKENIRAYVWTAVVSGFVGLAVASTALLIHLYDPAMLRILLLSALAGVVIGLICRAICLWLIGKNIRNPVFLWSAILGIVGIGTEVAAIWIGNLPLRKTLLLVVIAELLGIVIAYANYRQFVYVNKKLQQKKKEFLQ